ncbi:DUF397 domain-containing protein [Streptomyces sp. e14]|uniref:DUF397 domain-containing protein n=1 Tax=Streptomyces sp. e14 TaxID=645465 RepID=UPI0005BA9BA0|nr:DUF397 domain-containing protein [Streptomyces sp. e14]
MSPKPLAGDGTELQWFKSSHSNPDGAACVEVARTPATVHVRDSKDTRRPHLAFAPEGWAAFLPYAAEC